MDTLQLLITILYGVVEGITEWLPISSTGHMLLLDEVLSLDVTEEFWNMFLVVIQLGAILAVCVLYVRRLNPFAPSKSHEEKRATWLLWGKIVVACIPAAVAGVFLDDVLEEYLYRAPVIAAALIVYGVAFIAIECWRAAANSAQGGSQSTNSAQGTLQSVGSSQGIGCHFARKQDESLQDAALARAEDIPMHTAFGIGLFQVLALIPGTSRSGSTIIGGLLLGTTRELAAEFTFFLAIPVMFGASALRLAKYWIAGGMFSTLELQILFVGCAVAFGVSLVAIRWLTSFVRSHSFVSFGIYRIVLGAIVLAYALL